MKLSYILRHIGKLCEESRAYFNNVRCFKMNMKVYIRVRPYIKKPV